MKTYSTVAIWIVESNSPEVSRQVLATLLYVSMPISLSRDSFSRVAYRFFSFIQITYFYLKSKSFNVKYFLGSEGENLSFLR